MKKKGTYKKIRHFAWNRELKKQKKIKIYQGALCPTPPPPPSSQQTSSKPLTKQKKYCMPKLGGGGFPSRGNDFKPKYIPVKVNGRSLKGFIVDLYGGVILKQLNATNFI